MTETILKGEDREEGDRDVPGEKCEELAFKGYCTV